MSAGRAVFVQRVVGREIVAGPGELLGPHRRRCGPEGIGGCEAEREKGGAAEIEAAGGDVGFAEGGLVTGEADLKPAGR